MQGWRVVAGLLSCLAAGAALAGARPPDENPRSTIDPAVMQIEESRFLGQRLGGQTTFLDEQGQPFRMEQVLGKPVILVLSYYGCDGSCPTINQSLAAALKDVGRFQGGRDYRVLTVSFDRQDTPQAAQAFVAKMQQMGGAPPPGWRFAVLSDASLGSQERFAQTVGFEFFWSRVDKTFLHPNVLVFLTPEGRVARYIYGTRIEPRTLELALIEADWGRISESGAAVFDMITGACFSYNFSEGRYQPNYALLAGLGSLTFGLTLMAAGVWGYRRKLARRPLHAN